MREKIEQIIEQSFDVVRIGNKVYYTSKRKSDEKFKRRIEELLTLHGVVSSLPESKDRILELEKAIVRWDLKNDINDKQAFSCGWNNCYRWIKDFVRQQR